VRKVDSLVWSLEEVLVRERERLKKEEEKGAKGSSTQESWGAGESPGEAGKPEGGVRTPEGAGGRFWRTWCARLACPFRRAARGPPGRRSSAHAPRRSLLPSLPTGGKVEGSPFHSSMTLLLFLSFGLK
jgi:hypothetical protein